MDRSAEGAILHPDEAHRTFDYRRHDAGPLAHWLTNFWTITWDLDEPYLAQVLPLPTVNLSITNTEADVTGLVRVRYDRRLSGRGYAVGARFRPAMFRPWCGASVSALSDTHRPIADVLGRDTTDLQAAVGAADDAQERVRLLAAFLAEREPEPDPVAVRLASVVTEVIARADVVRVSQVAELAGVSQRTLQRLFVEYVGAGPKWLIERRRVLTAAARAAGEPEPDWAALAAELGYADQAHLSRSFAAAVGTPPATYARAVEASD